MLELRLPTDSCNTVARRTLGWLGSRSYCRCQEPLGAQADAARSHLPRSRMFLTDVGLNALRVMVADRRLANPGSLPDSRGKAVNFNLLLQPFDEVKLRREETET